MLLREKAQGISGTIDLSSKPDCRGTQFSDPGGWGLIKFSSGLIATVDAPDYAKHPISLQITGIKGAAHVSGLSVTIEYWDGRTERWPDSPGAHSSMDTAVNELVSWLDSRGDFCVEPQAAVDTLEIIAAFHSSHSANGAWVALPLTGENRKIIINSG